MKNRTVIVLVLSFLLSVTAAFSVGYHVREQKQPEYDVQACQTLLSLAAQKVKFDDISNPDTMESLISNIYAAWSHCPDSDAQSKLYDLWNALIFSYEDYAAQPELLMERLRAIHNMLPQKTKSGIFSE
jgi:hypothetical protein